MLKQKIASFGERSFSFEGGAGIRRKILRVWFSLVCHQQGKNKTVKMSQYNRRNDSTTDSSDHIVVRAPDVIYLFLEIMFVMFKILY